MDKGKIIAIAGIIVGFIIIGMFIVHVYSYPRYYYQINDDIKIEVEVVNEEFIDKMDEMMIYPKEGEGVIIIDKNDLIIVEYKSFYLKD